MVKHINSISVFIISLVFCTTVFARTPPVGMLFDKSGKVEYTKNGKKWKKVRRNKFVFEGYQVRTGADGSVNFINQKTNESRHIGENSIIRITGVGIEKVSGNLTQGQSAGNIFSGLQRRFNKSDKYTTVRRAAKKKKQKKKELKLYVGKITLSDRYPDLAWENIGEKYSYKLVVGSEEHDIPASDKRIIRFPVKQFNKDTKYYVEVLENGNTIIKARAKKVNWLSGKDLEKFEVRAKQIQSIDTDGFLYGNLLKDTGILVAAMDQYSKFFELNKDDEDVNELRPMYIEVLSKLKLKKLKKAEQQIYRDSNKK